MYFCEKEAREMEEVRPGGSVAREYNWLYHVIAAAAAFLACSFISGFEIVYAAVAVCVSTYLYTLKRSPFSLLGLVLGSGAALGYHLVFSSPKEVQRLVHSLFDNPIEIVSMPLISAAVSFVFMVLFCAVFGELMLRGARRSLCIGAGTFIGSLGVFLNIALMFYIKYQSFSVELFKEKTALLLRYVKDVYLFALGDGAQSIRMELLESQIRDLVFTLPASIVLAVFIGVYVISVIIKKLGVKGGRCNPMSWRLLPSKESAIMCLVLFILSFVLAFSDPDGASYYGIQMLLTPLRAMFFIVGIQSFMENRRKMRRAGMPGSGMGTVVLVAVLVLFFSFVSIFVTVMGLVAAFKQKTESEASDKK